MQMNARHQATDQGAEEITAQPQVVDHIQTAQSKSWEESKENITLIIKR